MEETRKVANRKRGSQLSIRIDATLYDEYKALIEQEGLTLTSDIEGYMKNRLGKKELTNVIDIQKFNQLEKDIADLKETVGKWNMNSQLRIENSRAS
ncbi:hypothetical protein CAL7716_042090 [Calothrix sp. PCC 7716]|nr:hypothetical protein CAL7716_042090 [Calothrix sp. PCC 7716]